MQNCGFDAGKRHEFVRMALFLIDSSTLLSQPHNAPTPGGAVVNENPGCLVHLWESLCMKQYQEMDIRNLATKERCGEVLVLKLIVKKIVL